VAQRKASDVGMWRGVARRGKKTTAGANLDSLRSLSPLICSRCHLFLHASMKRRRRAAENDGAEQQMNIALLAIDCTG